ncbi:MAG TPA: hypothetical protein VLX91_01835 [Candidatus Acidoferrales bacterium]|nr:hypothetical protein [Candidatus Acidoferrales bacterium]
MYQNYSYGTHQDTGPSTLTFVLLTAAFGLLLIILIGIAASIQKKRAKVVAFSHWHHSFEGFQISVQEFYNAVTELVKAKNIPNLRISRVEQHETAFYSAKREYLRIQRFELLFDICAAPFGPGFFTSWWLGERPTGGQIFLSMIPFMGGRLMKHLMPDTYFRKDTAIMFQDSIGSAVQEALEQQTSAKGIRALSEAERKPIINEKLFQ